MNTPCLLFIFLLVFKNAHGNHIHTDAAVFQSEDSSNEIINTNIQRESEGYDTNEENPREEINKTLETGALGYIL